MNKQFDSISRPDTASVELPQPLPGEEQWGERIVVDPPETIHADVCIVGAGIAGCALAWSLGRHGIKVVVLERDYSKPDKFIGELLQPGGVQTLHNLGLGDALEGLDAQPVSGYALFNDSRHFSIEYPEVNDKIAQGHGFRYGKFVMSLRNHMAQQPSVMLVKGSAKGLIHSDNSTDVKGIQYQTADGRAASVNANLSVLCDGASSRFRTELTSDDKTIKGFMVGLLLRDCKLPYPGHGHVFLTSESPCLAYPVSSDAVRVLVDFAGNKSPKASGKLDARLEELRSLLPEQMQTAYENAISDLKVKAMPNQLLPAGASHGRGVVILGDALNMRHPLTGGGMTVALSDVELLDELLSTNTDFSDTQRIGKLIDAFYIKRHRNGASINILADALYDVMKYPDLKNACFDYLEQGPGYSAGPIAILSAVSRDSSLLLRKFSAVALYASKKRLFPIRGLNSIKESFSLLHKAARIIRPLIKNEKPSWWVRLALGFSYFIFPRQTKPSE